jgi:hydroxyethylthiazole kinase-like uncharacterized protein yjeF
MRKAEQALIDAGDSVESLMKRAGNGAGDWIHRLAAGRPVTVLCGPGNNGGDGYVIAQHLAGRGVPVEVVAPLPPRTPAAMAARGAFAGDVLDGDGALPQGAVFVDCLFGSGLARAVDVRLAAIMAALWARHALRVAVDLPSGIEADSGAVLNPEICGFDLTLALGAWKHAHFAMPAAARMGALRLVDIGAATIPGAAEVLPRPVFHPPPALAHKYTRGLLAIVGGAMPGAAVLAAMAARHAGAGYLRLIAGAEPGAIPPDLVVERGPPLSALADPRIAAVLIGPGLGRDGVARNRLAVALAAGRPTVVDADGLILLRPGHGGCGPLVLTPHEGELAALERAFGLGGGDRAAKRDRAVALASASGAVVVAKGADTVLAAPDGRVMVAPRAPSWLSVAGTGDVLAGVIASRLAVHRDPWRAAGEGVWLQRDAARRAGPAFAAADLAGWVQDAVGAALWT